MRVVIPTLAGLGILLLYQGLISTTGRRRGLVTKAIAGLLAEAGLPRWTPRRLYVLSLSIGLMVSLFVAAVVASPTIAFALGLGSTWTPVAYARARRRARRRRFREAWPDAIAHLVSGVRAGISLPEACAALVERGPGDLSAGFRAFTSTYRATGSFRAALDRLRTQLADPVADRVVAALVIADQVGGTELVRVLRTLADFVREDLRVRREVEARWSWTVTAARVAAAAPWIVLLVMSLRPEAAAAYNSPSGIAVIVGGAGATLVGYRLMLRAAQLPDERRLVL
jgi:tight adherence protein B